VVPPTKKTPCVKGARITVKITNAQAKVGTPARRLHVFGGKPENSVDIFIGEKSMAEEKSIIAKQ